MIPARFKYWATRIWSSAPQECPTSTSGSWMVPLFFSRTSQTRSRGASSFATETHGTAMLVSILFASASMPVEKIPSHPRMQ